MVDVEEIKRVMLEVSEQMEMHVPFSFYKNDVCDLAIGAFTIDYDYFLRYKHACNVWWQEVNLRLRDDYNISGPSRIDAANRQGYFYSRFPNWEG